MYLFNVRDLNAAVGTNEEANGNGIGESKKMKYKSRLFILIPKKGEFLLTLSARDPDPSVNRPGNKGKLVYTNVVDMHLRVPKGLYDNPNFDLNNVHVGFLQTVHPYMPLSISLS